MELVKILESPTDHSYGVAGSRVTPMMITGVRVVMDVMVFVARVLASTGAGGNSLQVRPL